MIASIGCIISRGLCPYKGKFSLLGAAPELIAEYPGTQICAKATKRSCRIRMNNRAVVSVVGKDRTGIIARVAGTLAENGVNILDISQTILQGFFTMIMLVDLGEDGENLDKVRTELEQAAKDLGMQVTIQHEDVFNFMHRI